MFESEDKYEYCDSVKHFCTLLSPPHEYTKSRMYATELKKR